ncbi:MAG: hypothetical protein CL834_03855 [Crocinitomicaceae bacterium]|nr:hypothetical protein [Crocinitomicaceae bacterium]|tara:strand:+ start:2815 stop:5214 length:2400 start_codon:yes stop_codon:yes gene_type:complete
MKQVLPLAFMVLFMSTSYAQLTGISVEEYVDHATTGIEELEGFITYRVYADCSNAADEVSAVFGDQTSPLVLTSTDGFYQNTFGEPFGWNINPAFFGSFAALEYDSWITIGSEDNLVVGSHNTVGLDMASFEAGGDLILDNANGGSWFTLAGDPAAQAGADLKVLVAQLTIPSGASFTGNFNIQVFIDGDQSNSTQYPSVPFSSEVDAVFGCMDPDATNYNPDATEQGEVCTYPCALDISIVEVNGTSCPGVNDGMVVLTSTGDQLGVIFQIEGSDAELAVGNFDELAGGVYTISGLDGAGCVDSIDVEIVMPDPIVISASMTESVSCAGDSDAEVSGSVSGGTGEVVFSLSPDFIVSTDVLSFEGLSAGAFTVYAQDANGCEAASDIITVLNPDPVFVAVGGGQNAILGATCSYTTDGLANVLASGGSGNGIYSYSSNGVDFVDNNVLNLGVGTYTFFAMDVNGCIGQTANEYTVDGPDALIITSSTSAITCNGDLDGAISFDATGGNGGLQFSFNGAAANDTTSYSELAPGEYTITVTDTEGCEATEILIVDDASAVEATALVTNVSCAGEVDGSVELSASGGTSLFEYSADGTEFGVSALFIDLAPGEYTFYVEDSNGCETSVDASVEEPDPVQVTGSISNDTGAGDGELDITASGGDGDYSYSWSGPDNFTSADEDLIGIVAGEYTVEVTDGNGCTVTESFGVPVGISEWSFLQAVQVSPNPSNGMVNVTLNGATGEDVFFTLYDAQGRNVWNQTSFNALGQVRVVADFQGVANGIYQLQMVAGDSRNTVQLIKQ